MTGVLIPLYLYPSSLAVWKPVITAKQAYPSVPFVAIANPASGPGTASDPNYVTAIKSLQDAGVKVVGYVDTAYGAKSVAAITTEMQSWISWYSPVGFFFDDLSSSGQESTLMQLQAAATSMNAPLTIGNPGTMPSASYKGLLTDYVVYEGGAIGTLMGPGAYILYGLSAFPAGFVPTLLGEGATYVFFTDRPGPPANPYNVMSAYLMQLADSLGPPSPRPQMAEWVVAYRTGGTPLPRVDVTTWLESVSLSTVIDSVNGLGSSSVMLNLCPADSSGLLYQNVLKFGPSEVLWVPQVVYGAKALHYFPETIIDLSSSDPRNLQLDFHYKDGLMTAGVSEIDTNDVIFENSHSLPTSYTLNGVQVPLSPIRNAYIAVGGYGGGSDATFPQGTQFRVNFMTDPTVTDLAFSMYNGEIPPSGIIAVEEASNLYGAFPFEVQPYFVDYFINALPPDIAPTW